MCSGLLTLKRTAYSCGFSFSLTTQQVKLRCQCLLGLTASEEGKLIAKPIHSGLEFASIAFERVPLCQKLVEPVGGTALDVGGGFQQRRLRLSNESAGSISRPKRLTYGNEQIEPLACLR